MFSTKYKNIEIFSPGDGIANTSIGKEGRSNIIVKHIKLQITESHQRPNLTNLNHNNVT